MKFDEIVQKIKDRCLADGCPHRIPELIKKAKDRLDEKQSKVDHDLAYLVGDERDGYIHDMKIAQKWADLSRITIASRICEGMGFQIIDAFSTIHNYLGEDGIIRKSAIQAGKGQKVLIPLSMRDGSILAVGKGNEDWLCSAPHGAGRLMSRGEAKRKISMDDYRKSMEGIFTTSVCEDTLDEAPFAYKPADKIVEQIKDTVDVIEVLKPVYSFKASE